MDLLHDSGLGQWDPIDHIEVLLQEYDLAFERANRHALALHVVGDWGDIDICFRWSHDIETLFVVAHSDVRIKNSRRDEALRLVALVNESLASGHFEIRSYDSVLVFRHSICLKGTSYLSPEQFKNMIDAASSESERFYPAFQFLLWGGHKAETAIEMAMLETVGEA